MVVERPVREAESSSRFVKHLEHSAGVEYPDTADSGENSHNLASKRRAIAVRDAGPSEIEHLPSAEGLAGRMKCLYSLTQFGAFLIACEAGRRGSGRAAYLRIGEGCLVLPLKEGLKNLP
jgi:hypothetical protein